MGLFEYETDLDRFNSVIKELGDSFRYVKTEDEDDYDLYVESRVGTSAKISYSTDSSRVEIELTGSRPVVKRIENFLDNKIPGNKL